jgi:hypothetical protein
MPNKTGQAKIPCETYLILECVDPTEYAALGEASKDGLRIILSCGAIDATPGSIIRGYLESIFPSGATKTALDNLFTVTPPPHP